MEFNASNIHNVSLQNFDVDLIHFFHDVIQKELNLTDLSSNAMILNRLRSEYANKQHTDDGCSISFAEVEVRCAYMYQYGPSFTLAIASHLLRFMKGTSSQYVENLVMKDNLTLCCLGGGPGTEVLAICAVIKEVRRQCAPQKQNPLALDVTIVDIDPGWSTTAENVIHSIPGLLGSEIIERYQFLHHDMTQPMSDGVSRALGSSDLVTMSKFLSALHGPRDLGTLTEILKDTTEGMSGDSLLFLLDSSGWSYFEETVRIIGSFAWMQNIYGPHRMESQLSSTAMDNCISLFSAVYGHRGCTNRSVNKSAVSYKTSFR